MERVLLEFIEWGKTHWWFFGWTMFFCIPLAIVTVGGIVKVMIFTLPNRILRALNIWFRGWPPEGLDADGDLRKKINMTMNETSLKEFKKNIIDELVTRKG